MCLALVKIDEKDRFPLIIMHNRDEFKDRPTQAAERKKSGLICGQDLRHGGTWLALNEARMFALLTNIWTNENIEGLLSRGDIVERN